MLRFYLLIAEAYNTTKARGNNWTLPAANIVFTSDVSAQLRETLKEAQNVTANADLAVRKRRTEIDPQIGIVVELGREAGVATLALAKLVALIHNIEDGRRPMSFATFQDLIDTCASASTTASRS